MANVLVQEEVNTEILSLIITSKTQVIFGIVVNDD